MNPLEKLKNNLSQDLYSITKAEAHRTGICIQCKEPAFLKCYSEAGKREYKISGLCEQCFDKIWRTLI